MCIDYDLHGRDMTSEEILNYINDNLGDNKTRKDLNNIFESLKDKQTREITPKELAKIADHLNDEDLNYFKSLLVLLISLNWI